MRTQISMSPTAKVRRHRRFVSSTTLDLTRHRSKLLHPFIIVRAKQYEGGKEGRRYTGKWQLVKWQIMASGEQGQGVPHY